MWINRTVFFVLTFLLSGGRCCVKFSDGWNEISLEERAKRASVVFHGLAIETLPVAGDQSSYAVQFWLINVYKGSEDVGKFLNLYPGSGGVFNLRDRKINVTGFSYKSKCQGVVASQKYYIIFSELLGNELAAKFDDLFGASAEWSETNERRIWHAVGWENWSDWGPCSASCGEGSQERTRRCFLEDNDCRGYNKERRRCNMFSCQGAVDALRLDDQRYFHPSRGEWQRVAERPTAWKLRLNSYIWVPSSQLFRNKTTSRRFDDFPREFSLLVTLKLNPKKLMRGTLFSLRSRRQQNAYLSLELESPDRVRVVHSGKNGTPAVVIPMKLNDGHWHQMSIALQDDNSVRSFLDCSWISTDILKRNELDHPEDADLIIGYLFQGSLEQMMIVPNPGAVAQQCSSTKIPIFDKKLLDSDSGTTTTATTTNEGILDKGGRNQSQKKYNYLSRSKEVAKGKSKPDSYEDKDWSLLEGSGRGSSFGKAFYEVEWSEWSTCSSTCGDGMQSRYSRCVDDGSQLELCLEAGIERTEMRSCHLHPCHPFPVSASMESHSESGNSTMSDPDKPSGEETLFFRDFNRTTAHNRTVLPDRKQHHHVGKARGKKVPINRSWDFLKRRLLRENGSKKNWCSCLNGGTCAQKGNSCRCPEGYWGRFCENVSCQVACLNGGQCLEGNVCGCPSGFRGSRCENPTCDPPCRNGGTCIKPDVCLCPPQTTGSYCQKYYCSAPCLNGGTCVGPDQCECPHNATGKNCESPVCEPPCENGATCSPGNWCLCSPSSYGIRCERRKCEFVAVKVPFTKGFKRLIAKSNDEGKCETLPWKTCRNVVPEYQTVYKTFYKTVYKCREDLLGDEKGPK